MDYKKNYDFSVSNKEEFWREKGSSLITWDKMFEQVHNGDFCSSRWYDGGQLNACYNCIDRHYNLEPDRVALIYSDNDNNCTSFTFAECLKYICKVATLLKEKGLKKGDCVAIYMSMCPEAVFAALACARLGLIHNCIFGGFSPDSVLLRIEDSNSKFLITSNVVERASSKISFWENVETVVCKRPMDILVFDVETKSETKYDKPKALGLSTAYWSDLKNNSVDFIDHEPVDSEDILFYLYTSGSTGKPKGMVHTTAGYLVYAALTTKECFSLQKRDVFACTADIGWITGHTYSIYGPLLNGVTTVLFGGTPVHPDYYRLYKLVESLGITQLYTAPTVVRTLRKYFSTNEFVGSYNLNSLRLLGSVGEPINKEAYKWFTESFNNLHIVDSYWQTETGGIMIAPIPNTILGQPECASLPFYGIEPVVIKEESTDNEIYEAEPYELGRICFRGSWPGIARTILNDDQRYKSSYFYYKGLYFTGDEGYMDKDNLFWIRGRADDVINVSGHRLSTAEIESAACTDPNVAEAAVVAVEDEITGQGLCFFIALKNNISEEEANKSLKKTLRSKIGKLVNPQKIIICKGLPKTATGKIMRRVLRDILTGAVSEDLSTCINIDSIDAIKNASFGKI
ncbi:Acetyl-coenzyme A synthetase [Nosema granulosis]|uniref:acetate--CoA ligase n=1 Tax=Nosema granulosis TaxID=83296 RepID=A0A9P6GYT7_9MICR|nr:Acetyl-coenzyme A synthetase [Nosema granulosis]